MSELKINADLTEAIELLANKLGLAATEIIPHYVRRNIVYGISKCIAGVMFVILPLFLFLVKIPVPTEGYGQLDIIASPGGYHTLFFCIKLILAIIFICCGIDLIASHVENIFASKGLAVSQLLRQIIKD